MLARPFLSSPSLRSLSAPSGCPCKALAAARRCQHSQQPTAGPTGPGNEQPWQENGNHSQPLRANSTCNRLLNPLTTQSPPSPRPQLCRISAPRGAHRPAHCHHHASPWPAPAPHRCTPRPPHRPLPATGQTQGGTGGTQRQRFRGSPSHHALQKRLSPCRTDGGVVVGMMSCV